MVKTLMTILKVSLITLTKKNTHKMARKILNDINIPKDDEYKKAVKWLNIIFKNDQGKVKVILDGFEKGIIEPYLINQSVDEHLQILKENYDDPEEVKDNGFCEYMVGDFFYGKWYQFQEGLYHQVKRKLDWSSRIEKLFGDLSYDYEINLSKLKS